MSTAANTGRSEPSKTDTHEYVSFDESALRYYEAEPRRRVQVDFAAKTDRGLVRPHNEDHYLIVRRRREREVIATSMPVELLPRPEQFAYVAAVADGMGGCAFGELASYLALRTGWDMGGDEVKWPLKTNEREVEEIKRKATILFHLIDRSIFAVATEQPRLAGMGTTLTICYSIGPELFIFHVGDSRAYLFRGASLTPLTHDHTLGQALIDAGLAAPDSPEANRRRHVLTNVLGGPVAGITVDVEHRRLEDGDRVLLCSDGLTDLVKDDEIARTLTEHPTSADACQALLDLALQRGGKDNVTIVVGRYEFLPDDDLLDDD